MASTALEFDLPEGLDDAALLARVGERLQVEPGRVRTADRELLDTFDGRLRAAGLTVERPARRGASAELTLREPGRPVRRARVTGAGNLSAAALAPGAFKDRVAGVLEARALLPVARVRSRVRSFAVLNADAKTVVRLAVERVAAPPGVGARVRIEPLRGYDREFERTVRRLRESVGLVPAETPLFDAAVRAAGGRPEGVSSKVGVELRPGMRADAAAGLVLARLVDIVDSNVRGTVDDVDPEFLHDLRVSVRRARSVMRELAGVHAPAPRAHLRAELRWAQNLTGPVRDLDVQLLEWDELTNLVQTGAATQLAPLRRLIERRRAHELAQLRRGLRSRRFQALLAEWRALAAAPATGEETPEAARAPLAIEVVAADRIRSVYLRMVRDGRAIDADSPDTALHDLRKRGKELRYLLEFFGGLFPRDVVKPMVGALKDLQDVLGRFQDRSVQTDSLRASADALAAEPGGPDALLAAGLLISALQADQRHARADFAERFAAFAAPRQRALVRATFAKAD
jgi:CHAD domain-containing protein